MHLGQCHPKLTPERAIYEIESVKSYGEGKMRNAEVWLGSLIDKLVEAKKAGVDDSVFRVAQEQHQKDHILWEWWTAENSDGFHNPAEARESLTRSVVESKKGIQILSKAMAKTNVAKGSPPVDGGGEIPSPFY